ncbi:GNAT family N-acetyltransferase [Nocardia pneumoniae]|uniref:GNAT family N-acetyltransferase n=1 Tax=Nocardia pneumoniae TaxID=228601 RepID=UPI00059319A2|nr:GNAT family N-acetyltransferase [Nocardia pneumoniae]
MRIRNGAPDDAESIAQLHTASWRSAYAGMMPEKFLTGPLLEDRLTVWRERLADDPTAAGLFVAEEDDELVGFVYLTPTTDGRVLLDNLHAAPGRTRAGIGTRLLHHALEWAAAQYPGRFVYLEVLQANTAAIAFYERYGGRRTDARTAHFEQGFDLPEFEYSWPPGFVLR